MLCFLMRVCNSWEIQLCWWEQWLGWGSSGCWWFWGSRGCAELSVPSVCGLQLDVPLPCLQSSALLRQHYQVPLCWDGIMKQWFVFWAGLAELQFPGVLTAAKAEVSAGHYWSNAALQLFAEPCGHVAPCFSFQHAKDMTSALLAILCIFTWK